MRQRLNKEKLLCKALIFSSIAKMNNYVYFVKEKKLI